MSINGPAPPTTRSSIRLPGTMRLSGAQLTVDTRNRQSVPIETPAAIVSPVFPRGIKYPNEVYGRVVTEAHASLGTTLESPDFCTGWFDFKGLCLLTLVSRCPLVAAGWVVSAARAGESNRTTLPVVFRASPTGRFQEGPSHVYTARRFPGLAFFEGISASTPRNSAFFVYSRIPTPAGPWNEWRYPKRF